jgi:uncharacterized RDD family membrane protein YckC
MSRASALLMVLLVAGSASSAQEPAAERPERTEVIASWQRDGTESRIRQPSPRLPDVVRLGVAYTLPPDGAVGNVFVLGGDVTIEGRVERDLAVVFGTVHLASTASVGGTLTVTGGAARVDSGASVRRDIAIIGATLDAPADFASANTFVLDPTGLGGWADGLFNWVKRGLLWGRPIVPTLRWAWVIVGILFFLYLVLNSVFDRSIGTAVDTLRERPLTALLTGALVLLLVGPVCLLLAVSVVGIAVVPLVMVSLLVAAILGKIAATRWLGSRIVQEQEHSRAVTTRSFVIGFALLSLAYMIPVIGLATWAMTSVFGLGATALAFTSLYRRENPAPVRPVVAPAVLTVPPASGSVAASQEGESMPFTEGTSTSFGQPGAVPRSIPAGDLALFPRAPFLDRLASGVLDFILMIFITQIMLDRAPERLWMAVALIYFVGFWVWKGTTVGGLICQLRVVRMDGAPLRFADGLIRGLSAIFSLIVLGLGFLWVLKDSERQAWHDRIAGTYVVKVPRNYPI